MDLLCATECERERERERGRERERETERERGMHVVLMTCACDPARWGSALCDLVLATGLVDLLLYSWPLGRTKYRKPILPINCDSKLNHRIAG